MGICRGAVGVGLHPPALVTLGPCTGGTGGHGQDVALGSPAEGRDGAILSFSLFLIPFFLISIAVILLVVRFANGGSDYTRGNEESEGTVPRPSIRCQSCPRQPCSALPSHITLRTRHICCAARVTPGPRGSRLEDIQYIDVQEKALTKAAAQ